MINFEYARANDVADAVRQIAADPTVKFIAGGTNLVDLMKANVERPSRLIDITRLPLHARVSRGLSRTFQINQLFPELTPLETVGLAVSEHFGRGGDWWRRLDAEFDYRLGSEPRQQLHERHDLEL